MQPADLDRATGGVACLYQQAGAAHVDLGRGGGGAVWRIDRAHDAGIGEVQRAHVYRAVDHRDPLRQRPRIRGTGRRHGADQIVAAGNAGELEGAVRLHVHLAKGGPVQAEQADDGARGRQPTSRGGDGAINGIPLGAGAAPRHQEQDNEGQQGDCPLAVTLGQRMCFGEWVHSCLLFGCGWSHTLGGALSPLRPSPIQFLVAVDTPVRFLFAPAGEKFGRGTDDERLAFRQQRSV